jgi:pimeloyl-ACP methyl ester carboxylesterase
MLRGTLRTIRYIRGWQTGADISVQQVEIEREGTVVPATLLHPAGRDEALPAWVVLGGVSRMGRFHPQLMRFAGALASTGAVVLVPEIPEWRSLKVSPRPALPTIRGCIDLLAKRKEARPGKVGLAGFSFGAPQVAIAAAEEDLADRIAGIVLFGGYCSLERTVICQHTGDHEWEGVRYELNPDPYGRWVMGSLHLTDVAGCEDAGDVCAALHRLAAAASDLRIPAWDPRHDTLIGELRLALPPKRRALFDLFATPTTQTRPERSECLAMARSLAEACRRVEPLLEPGPHLAGVTVPTRLFHGRGDRLMPFTESMRLSQRLPSVAMSGLTVTRLFGHSADQMPHSLLERVREKATFLAALRGVINTV